MKILQVINSFHTGGAQKLLADSLIKYKEAGLDVDVFVLNGEKTHLYSSVQNLPGVTIHSSNSNLSFYNPRHIWQLRKIMKHYDVIHVHLFPILFWASLANMLLGGRNSRRCLIYTEHSTDNKRRKSLFFRTLDRFIYRQFSYLVTISAKAADNLQKHLGKRFTNIFVILNGVDVSVYENAIAYQKEELGFQDSDILLIQVSSLRYPKDQATVIKALAKLENKSVHLLLAGEGPMKLELQTLTEKLGLTPRVHFMGVRSDVPSLLKTADFVILSSEYEGLSLASVEGMASGKPFLATNVPGLQEVVQDAGILFDYADEHQLKNNIEMLLRDPALKRKTIQACQEKARMYDIQGMIDKYISLYRRGYSQLNDIS